MKNLFAILLIAASIGIIFAYIRPTWGQIELLQAEQVKYTEALERVETLSTTLDQQQVALGGIPTADLERLNKLLPDSVDNVRLIMDISNIASSQGLAIQNINIAQQEDEPVMVNRSRVNSSGSNRTGYDSIDLSFTVNAPYNQFIGFITSIEQSLRLVDIKKVSFEPGNVGNTYNFSVTITTYWLK